MIFVESKNLPLAGLAGVAAYLTIVAQQTNELNNNQYLIQHLKKDQSRCNKRVEIGFLNMNA